MEKDKLKMMTQRSRNVATEAKRSDERPQPSKRKAQDENDSHSREAKRKPQASEEADTKGSNVEQGDNIELILKSYITQKEFINADIKEDLDTDGKPKRYYIKEQAINEKYSIADGRHVENPFVNDKQDPNFDYNEHQSLVIEQLIKLIKEYEERSPPTLDRAVAANGEKVVDPYIASGTSGSIYVYFKLYQLLKENKDIQKQEKKYSPNYFMNKAIKALETNFKLIETEEKNNKHKRSSFF